MHFPLKLYEIVQAGPAHVIAWSDSGKSFLVVNADDFCAQVLPRHFRHSKLTSFQRQLNLYGFQRIVKGTEAGRYHHPLFERGRAELLNGIKRESRAGELEGTSGGQGGSSGAKGRALSSSLRRSGGRDDGEEEEDDDQFVYGFSAAKAARQAGLRPGARSGTRSSLRSTAAPAQTKGPPKWSSAGGHWAGRGGGVDDDAGASAGYPQASVSAGGSFVYANNGHDDEDNEEDDGGAANYDDGGDGDDDDGGDAREGDYRGAGAEGYGHSGEGSPPPPPPPSLSRDRSLSLISAAAPEDHTAALAMLNISRSLSSESIHTSATSADGRSRSSSSSSYSSAAGAGGDTRVRGASSIGEGCVVWAADGCPAGGVVTGASGVGVTGQCAELSRLLALSEDKASALSGEVERLQGMVSSMAATIKAMLANAPTAQAPEAHGLKSPLCGGSLPAGGCGGGSVRADSPGCSSEDACSSGCDDAADDVTDGKTGHGAAGSQGKRRHEASLASDHGPFAAPCEHKALGHAFLLLRRSSSTMSSPATDGPSEDASEDHDNEPDRDSTTSNHEASQVDGPAEGENACA